MLKGKAAPTDQFFHRCTAKQMHEYTITWLNVKKGPYVPHFGHSLSPRADGSSGTFTGNVGKNARNRVTRQGKLAPFDPLRELMTVTRNGEEVGIPRAIKVQAGAIVGPARPVNMMQRHPKEPHGYNDFNFCFDNEAWDHKASGPVAEGTIYYEESKFTALCAHPKCAIDEEKFPDEDAIKCDMCLNFYHNDCVGLTEIPDGDEPYICPFCKPFGVRKHRKRGLLRTCIQCNADNIATVDYVYGRLFMNGSQPKRLKLG